MTTLETLERIVEQHTLTEVIEHLTHVAYETAKTFEHANPYDKTFPELLDNQQLAKVWRKAGIRLELCHEKLIELERTTGVKP